jgi:hypothetical protein
MRFVDDSAIRKDRNRESVQMNSSKASYIREAFDKLGNNASFEEVKEYILQEKEIEVRAQQVSNERTKRLNPKPQEITADVLKQVKELVDRLGSFDATRRALDALEEILKK